MEEIFAIVHDRLEGRILCLKSLFGRSKEGHVTIFERSLVALERGRCNTNFGRA